MSVGSQGENGGAAPPPPEGLCHVNRANQMRKFYKRVSLPNLTRTKCAKSTLNFSNLSKCYPKTIA